MDKKYKSGFAAVIGRPNVGKSTLINNLIGQKIAIMSDKPQTTRNKILCVMTQKNMQVVFIDTPGIHKPIDKLGEHMVRAAQNTLNEVDVILFVVDANEKIGGGERYIMKRLQAAKKPVLLIVNKIDLIKKETILPIINKYENEYSNIYDAKNAVDDGNASKFATVVPISAKNKENLSDLLTEIEQYLPVGPQYFPEDMVTDQPERLIVAELIREKVLLSTRDEVPHAVAVDVDEMTTRKNGDVYVRATIYVERESQKKIVIGAKGGLLKQVGANARSDIQNLLGSKIYLDLWVKVKKDWRDRERVLREFGFND
ncbi:GTPase Era [Pectinatus frisingensis]|uniref:GTPase Era n=1 Tax=Pectinatus frisingensis TaxID=865 RepID=UPI0018C508FD|nr:GTPase Era [Pectinatus frisingensis]